MNWTLQPLLRPLFAWLFGMLFSLWFSISPWIWCCLLMSILVCFFILEKRQSRWMNSKVAGLLLLLLFFTAGAGIYQWRVFKSEKWSESVHQARERSLEVTLREEMPSAAGPAYRAVVSYTGEPSLRFPLPDILVRFGKEDSVAWKYTIYDKLQLKGVLQHIRSTTNPEAFDYASYLRFQNIAASINVAPDCHARIKRENAGLAFLFAHKVHRWMKDILKKRIADAEVLAVNIALMTGDDFLIENTLYQAYSITGAVHVLSVSGLHVAIFIGPFLWFSGLWKTRRLPFVIGKILILLSMIGFYLLITGLSPSVVRSGAMIAMVLIAKSFRRDVSAMHTLTLSAFLMLAYDPFYIHQVSFLFSYLSLAGILVFEPRLSQIWQPSFWLIKQLWKLTIVSIAAQVFITPWSLWYFHQFSCSFILSGWIAVPVVTVIMYYSTAVLILEAVQIALPVVFYEAWVSLTQLMNYCIILLAQVPFSAISDVFISDLSLWMMLIFQFFFVVWISGRAGWAKAGIAGSIIVLLITYYGQKWQQQTESGLIVYDVYRKSLVELFSSGSGLTWTTHAQSDKSIQNASKNFRIKQGYTTKRKLTDETTLMCLCEHLVLVAARDTNTGISNNMCDTDILVDTGQSEIAPEILTQLFRPDKVVLGGAVPFFRRKKWEELSRANTFQLHHVTTSGAFLLSCSGIQHRFENQLLGE